MTRYLAPFAIENAGYLNNFESLRVFSFFKESRGMNSIKSEDCRDQIHA